MGLPVDDEQRDEGEAGESQTEAAIRTPPPISKKRKNKKRYFVSHEHPDSHDSLKFLISHRSHRQDDECNEAFVGPCSEADVCRSFCLSSLPDDCGSTSPTVNMKAVCDD